MAERDNPFCSQCHLRTFPQWGPHTCPPENPDLRRIRHVAGDILSNLHFYRVPADQQVRALTEALGLVLGTVVDPYWVSVTKKSIFSLLEGFIDDASRRVRQNLINENLVMEVNRPRLKAKKGGSGGPRPQKTHRSNRQAVQTRRGGKK